ncbi:hypothetical protein ZWY2020_000330 [Hordeum vulgare]|nr:hypothetical protein ZWY2020_000330 [Hordeum vulgare]
MSLNLGLDGGRVKDTFAPPFVGTKFAMYPACPRPDLLWGLRAHRRQRHHPAPAGRRGRRAGVLQGRPGVGPRGPHQGQQNLRQPRGPAGGDERRRLQGVLHRVAAVAEGGGYRWRRSTTRGGSRRGASAHGEAAGGAGVPRPYRFGDYLDYYQGTKFADKAARLQAVKELFGSRILPD